MRTLRSTVRESVLELAGALDSLGFVIHQDKSVLEPVQAIEFLGFTLDARDMTVRLTQDKVDKFHRAAWGVLLKKKSSIREVAGLIGLMVAYTPGLDYGGAHLKILEREKNEALKRCAGDFDALTKLSTEAQREIFWWLENIPVGLRRIRCALEQITVCTDTSEAGWGAHRGTLSTGGRFSQEELPDHINPKELWAILFGLQALVPEVGEEIRVLTDNTTALAYVKNMGGVVSPRCNEVAKLIWEWAERNSNWLTIAHIPGVENVLADFKSRNFNDDIEWEINDKIFRKICGVFGTPEIDLFASRLNKKLDCFVSWQPEPDAWRHDAFTFPWTDHVFYIFPPFSLVGKVVHRAIQQGTRGVIVVPDWPGQAWYSRLLNHAGRKLRFRKARGNLVQHGEPRNPKAMSQCPLVACLL